MNDNDRIEPKRDVSSQVSIWDSNCSSCFEEYQMNRDRLWGGDKTPPSVVRDGYCLGILEFETMVENCAQGIELRYFGTQLGSLYDFAALEIGLTEGVEAYHAPDDVLRVEPEPNDKDKYENDSGDRVGKGKNAGIIISRDILRSCIANWRAATADEAMAWSDMAIWFGLGEDLNNDRIIYLHFGINREKGSPYPMEDEKGFLGKNYTRETNYPIIIVKPPKLNS